VRVIVAGAAGFIGSHLVEDLLHRDYTVLGVDSLITGVLSNLESPMSNPEFSFINHDLSQPSCISQLVDFSPDAIVDLASPASPDDFLRIPDIILHAGSTVVFNLLDVARITGARLVFASSSEVYGDPEVHPQSEEYLGAVSTSGPRSCYDEAKRFAEAAITSFGRTFGIRHSIARIFNTYGPRMRENDGRVVSNFLYAALKGEPLIVYGDGNQTRSFCFVDDTVAGLIALLKYDKDIIINLGNPDEISIRDLAQRIVTTTKSVSAIELREIPPGRVGDPKKRQPDITRASDVLGWLPQIGLTAGLELYADYVTQSAKT